MPETTVIGTIRKVRRDWIYALGRPIAQQNQGSITVLAVQTLRNWLMMSAALGSVTIALSVGTMALLATMSRERRGGGFGFLSGWDDLFCIKIASLITCFVLSFMCFLESMRHLNHLGFMIPLIIPKSDVEDGKIDMETALNPRVAASTLARAGTIHTLGIRLLLLSFPILMWLFNAYLMAGITTMIVLVLQWLDDEPVEIGGTSISDVRQVEPRLSEHFDEEVEPLLINGHADNYGAHSLVVSKQCGRSRSLALYNICQVNPTQTYVPTGNTIVVDMLLGSLIGI
ncbi:hypothetical protein SeLEV6574_g03040 [Synchytrium endobioticum]|uniref:Uncharacterized protein n=1 Tax=Synchytrium endobioticum TaxID=286115 RepID=A0A507D5Z1_9FUNG|nr:hypothetical protein SeLEV6574_g03040 [Synchytrium endobioticum]